MYSYRNPVGGQFQKFSFFLWNLWKHSETDGLVTNTDNSKLRERAPSVSQLMRLETRDISQRALVKKKIPPERKIFPMFTLILEKASLIKHLKLVAQKLCIKGSMHWKD